MSIIISYNKHQNNWYVGELYEYFAKAMGSEQEISIIPIHELAKIYSEPNQTRENGYLSLFNIYNLIVYNPEKHIGFVHSLSDHSATMLEHKSALEKLGIKAMSFCSNLTNDIIEKYKYLDINIIPSFYVLEHWNDHDLIEKEYASYQPKTNQCYFNGACYGHRANYINSLRSNSFFNLKDKSNPEYYRTKQQYYQEFYQHRYGLSLNGAAKICYRDLECFGLGSLCLRESMEIKTKDQLLPDKHYKVVLDDFITQNIYDPDKSAEVIERLLHNINNISTEEEEYIVHNARSWFINNAKPDTQVMFLKQCLLEINLIDPID